MLDEDKKEKSGWRKFWDGVFDWATQWFNGPKWLRKKQMIARVAESEEGKRLLELAKAYSIPIRVVMFRRDEKNSGTVDKRAEDATVGITVSNNGDPVDMATTLHHELRHVEQQRARGTVAKGFFGGLRDAARQHVISLMEEADAFTAEIVEAFRRDAAGQHEYLDNLRERNGLVTQHVQKLLRDRPYESFATAGAFSQALFTHLMKGGLDHYSADYFEDYAKTFKTASDLTKFRAELQQEAEPPKDRPAEKLMALYGGDFRGAMSLGGLAGEFFKVLSPEVKNTLKLIEKTVRNADKISAKDYKRLRKEIIKRSNKLSRDFNKAGAKAEEAKTSAPVQVARFNPAA